MGTKMNLLDQAKALRQLLDSPASWTKGVTAWRTEGRMHYACDPTHPGAYCWCLTGGIGRITGYNTAAVINHTALTKLVSEEIANDHQFKRYAKGTWGVNRIVELNDNERTTHADVLRLLDLSVKSAAIKVGNAEFVKDCIYGGVK